MRKNKQYDFKHFAFDTLMVVITGGVWGLWIVIREFQIHKK